MSTNPISDVIAKRIESPKTMASTTRCIAHTASANRVTNRAKTSNVARSRTARFGVVARASKEEELMAKLMGMMGLKSDMVTEDSALPGRDATMRVSDFHYVFKKNKMKEPFPENLEQCVFATGCFWGTEKMFWRMPGVYTTAVGYVGGFTKNPSYEEVCSGRTGHTECVRVVYDPSVVSFADLLSMHWTCHDPTQGNRQGNDRGTQYRSGIYCSTEEQLAMAKASAEVYQEALKKAGRGEAITSEIKGPGDVFYFAEDYHQQYLAKPMARPYCSAQPTGVPVPEDWLKANGAKFGMGFWKTYGPRPGCTINVPNGQVTLDEALAAN